MEFKRKNKIRATFRTIFVNAAILLLLLWGHFRTPIPPYPEGGGGSGQGLEVSFGLNAEGMADDPAEVSEQAIPVIKIKPVEEVSSPNEKVLTQETEDEGSVPLPTDNKMKVSEKKVVPIVKTIKPKVEKKQPVEIKKEAAVVTKPVLNSKALFPSKVGNASQGDGNTPGVAGNPNGKPGSGIYSGTGTGSGGGTGGGSGTGTGTGTGPGISFSLEGRNISHLQSPEYKAQVEGKVVVEITVDNQGKVTQAVPGVKGSTTLDDYLLEVARKAALQSKFSAKPDAPAFQKGTITYKFLLQ